MEILKTDILLVLQFYGVFLLAYSANVLFSLYLNINIHGEDFNKYRLLNAFKKAFVFVIATLLLVIAVDLIAVYLINILPDAGNEIKNMINMITIIATIGRASLKYLTEAYQTFQNVLNGITSNHDYDNP